MQAQLESERKASLAALATEQEGKILVQVSRQSAIHSACLTTCVLQAKGSVDHYLWCFADALLSVFLLSFSILQASLEIAQEGAKRMSATKSALEQEVQRMAQVSSSRWVLSASITSYSLVLTPSHIGHCVQPSVSAAASIGS
jgi:hypothetical protein